jgi:glycosyltransferase involved in cell wall biosynthesis
MYSVIIPSFNRCQVLTQALDSVLRQAVADLEIIVVDDGSTDDTAAMLARCYPQVRYVYQPNRGPAAARNTGIALASGEFIAFLDSDDIWLDNKIALEMALLQRFPKADALVGNASSYVQGKLHAADRFARFDIAFPDDQPRFFDWSMSAIQYGPICCTGSMTFKKATLDQLGAKPFDETLRLDEDWDFEFRLFNQSYALLYPELVCECRIFYDGTRQFYSPTGISKSREEQLRIWQQQNTILNRYLNHHDWDQATRQIFFDRAQHLQMLSESFDCVPGTK